MTRHHEHHHQRLTSILVFAVTFLDYHRHRHHSHHHPQRIVHMSNVTLSVGHSADFSIVFLDQNGNPMLTTPVPDAPPVWTDTTPATGTLVPAASGLTAVEAVIAVGGDTVSVSLAVGGVTF